MTIQHTRHWYGRGSASTKQSGRISSYDPRGGVPGSSKSSQRQAAGSRRSRQLGTSAGRAKKPAGVRIVTRQVGALGGGRRRARRRWG